MEWARDPRFATAVGRLRHRKDLDHHIAKWTRSQDKRALMARLQAVGIPATAVFSNKDAVLDEHVRERGFFETISHPDIAEIELPGIPWKMSETPGSIRLPPPTLGQHNDYLYREVLGLNEAEIARLEEQQITGTVPLDRLV